MPVFTFTNAVQSVISICLIGWVTRVAVSEIKSVCKEVKGS